MKKRINRSDIWTSENLPTFDTPILWLNKCRRCGEWIEETRWANKVLWCDTCRKLVDKELQGKTNRPFEYFFEYYRAFERKNVEKS